jgi:hypothetical protein
MAGFIKDKAPTVVELKSRSVIAARIDALFAAFAGKRTTKLNFADVDVVAL